ncbi:MAG TPA: hypothetical protein PKZ76_11505 [Xanthomonadaceae bacterium]|nr:hypothetical protein [Xanthomonadaceae bacterium]
MSLRTAFVVFAILLLAACAGSGPPKRIHPPGASIQEITVQADGSWRVLLRVHSFSTVATRFQNIALDLALDGASAGRLSYDDARDVPGQSAEIFRLRLVPAAEAVDALAAFKASGRRSLAWTLHGGITVDGRTYRNEYAGRLSPAPGLTDTYR